jgi:acetate kinase
VRVLVVNAGSSSLKLAVLDGENRIAARTVERWDGDTSTAVLQELLDATGPVDAVGHRIVHGGPTHAGPARITARLVAELAALVDLAPQHQPRCLAGIRTTDSMLAHIPAVACFDTAFHRTIPAAAATYALPAEWNAAWGLQRFGFHGLSHAYASARAAELVDAPSADLRVVTCHLGAGASLCAVRGGVSVDTTMGFTPLEGVAMATRSGTVDPGLLLWLIHRGMSPEHLADALEHRSGLAGLSGTSGDLRDVLAARAAGSQPAALSYDVFLHRLVTGVAAMAASAGGLDVLVLTGGMGEHSPQLRADLADGLAFLGVAVDRSRNDDVTTDADISADGTAVSTLVVTAREDVQIARETAQVLDGEWGTLDPADVRTDVDLMGPEKEVRR